MYFLHEEYFYFLYFCILMVVLWQFDCRTLTCSRVFVRGGKGCEYFSVLLPLLSCSSSVVNVATPLASMNYGMFPPEASEHREASAALTRRTSRDAFSSSGAQTCSTDTDKGLVLDLVLVT